MKLSKIFASGFGTGYAPVAPGTVGSLLGIVVFYFINFVFVTVELQSLYILVLNLVFIIALALLGVMAIKRVHRIWGHDASAIVIDEVVGVCIAAVAIPFRWEYYAMAFFLFRFFDILKPFFIKRIDKMKGDWPVMLDDVLAGVYANIVLQVIIYLSIL